MWLVGGIYECGYNVEVWLVGVVVRRYIDILTIINNFPNSTCISSFLGSSIRTSLFIFKMFFRSCLCNICTVYTIANVTQRTFEMVQKNRDHANIIII